MHLPGRPHPGTSTPGQHLHGFRTPGDADPSTVSATGVAVDATGTTDLGTADGDRDLVLVVTVNGTAADFDFNVNADGSPLFAADQSPGGTAAEDFTPTEPRSVLVGAADETVTFEVTSVSATGGATADVDVDIVSDAHI